MMNAKEFLTAVDNIVKEKGIDKEIVFEAMETALTTAFKKNYGKSNSKVVINRETGDIKVYSYLTVISDDLELTDEEGNIYINGEILDEDYGKEVIQDPGLAAQEITLGEDEYWCMGDNRNHSSDSRVIGPVPRSHILGKAFVRIYPFSKFGLIH